MAVQLYFFFFQLSSVISRTVLLLSRHYVLLDRAIRHEDMDEAVNPLSAPLGRIQDEARDMACLALRAARRPTADATLLPGLAATVDAIGLTYDRSTIELYDHLGSTYRSWIDYIHLRNLGLDLAELRTLYMRLVNIRTTRTRKANMRRFS